MRLRLLIPSILLVCAVTGGTVTAHAAGDRFQSFDTAAARLRAEWSADQAQGVPASSLAPLRASLSGQSPAAPWWSPAWFANDGAAVIARLETQTRSAWTAALAQANAQAEDAIAQWSAFVMQQNAWLDPDAVAAGEGWPAKLAAARTPAEVTSLAASWRNFTASQRVAVTAAQRAKLDQLQRELQSAGGPEAVVATAQRLVGIAGADNLDAGNVAALADRLSTQIANNGDALDTGSQLLAALSSLQSLINLNNQVAGQVRPLMLTVDQAEAEGTPNSAALAAAYRAIGGQFAAARTTDQLNAVAQTMATINTQLNADLAADQCGHNVGSGKVITVSLSLQEMVFYQDGCAVKATPVSTGRPELRTPTGTFSIFNKQTPFQFISPWPKSSPYYYYPSWVSWVMEFAGGGYFIHDAPWEAADAYGPGSEDNPDAASHGCIHVPTPVMQWAYSWAPAGTSVVISA